MAEQPGPELSDAFCAPELGDEHEQILDAHQRHHPMQLCDVQRFADEDRQRHQHCGAHRVRRRDLGSVAEQLRQIEQSRLDALKPLRDGLAAHTMPPRDLLERLAALSLADRSEDVSDAVDLAGKRIDRQHALTAVTLLATGEDHRQPNVARWHLQSPHDP